MPSQISTDIEFRSRVQEKLSICIASQGIIVLRLLIIPVNEGVWLVADIYIILSLRRLILDYAVNHKVHQRPANEDLAPLIIMLWERIVLKGLRSSGNLGYVRFSRVVFSHPDSIRVVVSFDDFLSLTNLIKLAFIVYGGPLNVDSSRDGPSQRAVELDLVKLDIAAPLVNTVERFQRVDEQLFGKLSLKALPVFEERAVLSELIVILKIKIRLGLTKI